MKIKNVFLGICRSDGSGLYDSRDCLQKCNSFISFVAMVFPSPYYWSCMSYLQYSDTSYLLHNQKLVKIM